MKIRNCLLLSGLLVIIVSGFSGCYRTNKVESEDTDGTDSNVHDTSTDSSGGTTTSSSGTDDTESTSEGSDSTTGTELEDCYNGDYLISGPEELQDFISLSCIRGDLTISSDVIEDLELPNLTRIYGRLSVEGNPLLREVAMPALIELNAGVVIGCVETDPDDYTICENQALESLSGLATVSSIGGDITVNHNPKLTDVAVVSNLSHVDGSIVIANNDSLQALNGMEHLESIMGDFILVRNRNMDSFEGGETIQSIGGSFYAQFLTSLASTAALNSLVTVEGDLLIQDAQELTNVEFPNLNAIGGSLSIGCSPLFTYSCGNPMLASISGLSSLKAIGESLYIGSNGELENLVGLENLTSVPGDVDIRYNPLTSLEGVSSISEVGGDLIIRDNYSLTSIDQFQSLSSIEGALVIWNNEALNNLSGLNALSIIYGNSEISWLVISNNYNLPYCTICELWKQLISYPSWPESDVSSNHDDACGASAQTVADLSCS